MKVQAAMWSLMLGAACGGGMNEPGTNCSPSCPFTDVPPPPGGVAQFSVLPVSIAPGQTLTALGNLNPPGHVLPTDHVYFYDWDLSSRTGSNASNNRTVYMPATGAVFFVFATSARGDTKVMFRATDSFYFYLDHVQPSASMAVGQIIQAGTPIGTTGVGVTLDLGAFDQTVTHSGFLIPARYPFQTLHYVSPWKYFTPDLQSQIKAHMYRAPTAADSGGTIDFGVWGKLVGDWFLPAMPIDSSSGPYGWTRSISFAYDYYDPSQVRISIGGTVDSLPGVWAIDSTAPRPEKVSVGSGLVTYKLYSPFDPQFPPIGMMLVQMTDSATIKVEVFRGTTSKTAFDANAFTFVR